MLDVGGLVKGVMSYVTKLELVASVLSRWVRCIFLRLHRGNGIKINIFIICFVITLSHLLKRVIVNRSPKLTVYQLVGNRVYPMGY